METAGHGRENYSFCATEVESKLPERELRQKVSQEGSEPTGALIWYSACFYQNGTLHVSIRMTDLLSCG